MMYLPENFLQLLKQVIEERSPKPISLINNDSLSRLNKQEINELQDIVGEELMSDGFENHDPDWKIKPYENN